MISRLLAFSLPVGPTGTPESIPLPKQIQNITNLLGSTDITKRGIPGAPIIGWALAVAFTAAIVAALAYVLYGGWKWITSNGDAKNLETAHNIIIYAVVGMGIVLLSAFFVNVAAGFFCIPLLGALPQACQ